MNTGLSKPTVSAVLGATAIVAGKAFEIHAVDEHAKDLLSTANLLSGQLEQAISLRRQKAHYLLNSEKQRIDRTLSDVEAAIEAVASLAEGVRADSEAFDGKVRMRTRMLFVLRDCPRIRAALTRLTIAAASLDRELTILCTRGTCCSQSEAASLYQLGVRRGVIPTPPTYAEATFLTEMRAVNSRRRSNAISELDNTEVRSRSSSRMSFELAADDGYGPSFDRATLNGSRAVSIISACELFLETWVQASPAEERAPSDERAPSEERSSSAMRGRQRSLRWLEARASDKIVLNTT